MGGAQYTTATDAYISVSWNESLADSLYAALGDFSLISDAQAAPIIPVVAAPVSSSQVYPSFKLGSRNYFLVYTVEGKNFLQISNVIGTDASGVYTLANGITPKQMHYIDTKTDDGNPQEGAIQAVGGTGPVDVPAVPGAGNCVDTINGTVNYNLVTNTLANSFLCQLSTSL
jgi:hypothetical protein